MPLSEIARALVRRGVITSKSAVEAEQRRKLYGGGLDTALLELQASDEETLCSHLAEIIGIPLAPLAWAAAPPNPAAREWMDGATAQRLGAAPRALQGDVLDVLVRPEHDHEAMVAWAQARSLLIEPALVCEARFRALLRTLYGLPMAPRYLALLARLVGAAEARVVVGAAALPEPRTPTPVAASVDRIDTLLAAARLGDLVARRAALRRLSRHVHDPRVLAFRHALVRKAEQADPAIAMSALEALAELRDKNAVPAVAELLDAENAQVATAAHETLVALTCDDVGHRSKRWMEWWTRMGGRPRVEWLLEGLAHRAPEIRLLAASELHEISHEYFGYHHDLPERDREEARQRWIAWWQRQTAAKLE
ncbi:MAG: hypothetical protein JXP73_22260 [Deltaproteobacteria bacterium]|nr:hypothetical protein [Deltaproteobacteria bacterium]